MIAISGTNSLPEVATNFVLECAPLTEDADPESEYVHVGMLGCSEQILHVIREKLSGPYNAVADEHVNNTQFTRAIANVLQKKMFLPKIPEAMITAAYGEMGSIVLRGVRASNGKIKATGFKFEHSDLKSALQDVFRKR